MDYTQLIERLRIVGGVGDEAAAAIEALQKQIAEQDHELADTAFLAGQYKTERDAALANLRELKSLNDLAVKQAETLLHYYTGHRACWNDQHADAVLARLHDFKKFQRDHPERMKYPDTAAAKGGAV